jgi:predicted dehydrogenase
MADAFPDRLNSSLAELKKAKAEKVDVPEEHKFIGFDAYKKRDRTEADVVILATPPGFRPIHFEEAVKQGKHIFMEKPVSPPTRQGRAQSARRRRRGEKEKSESRGRSAASSPAWLSRNVSSASMTARLAIS